MWIIYLKILLALVLTIIPFWYAYYVRPRQDKPGIWRNGFTFLAAKLPAIGRVLNALANFVRKLHEGMRRSTSCRKFYILIFLLTIITYQYIDFHAANNAFEMAKNMVQKSGDKPIPAIINYRAATDPFTPFLTHPFATVIAAFIGLIFFFYEPANRLLNLLHQSRGIYSCVGLVCLFLLLSTANYFIVAETLFIFLIAAYFYPKKISDNYPGGKKAIPEDENKQQTIRLAA